MNATVENNVKTQNIYEAMAAINEELDAIGKNQKNQQQGFKFRGIDDVYNAINPLLKKHGVFCLPEIINNDRQLISAVTKDGKERQTVNVVVTIKYAFVARDGSAVSVTVLGEGIDYGDKATSKAMAIAHKYAFLQIFAIPTEDMADPDKDSYERTGANAGKKPDPLTAKKAPSVEDILANFAKINISENNILEFLAIDNIKEVTAEMLQTQGARQFYIDCRKEFNESKGN